MPQANKLEKAKIIEIEWDKQGQVQELPDKEVTVQFNPQSLKLSFSNQRVGGDQRGGAPSQFVGRGTTKLSLQLWFDVTVLAEANVKNEKNDVRQLTADVAYFITPKKKGKNKKGKDEYIPPGLRFIWGSFLFEGVMDSMDETLELFSADGRPLRANVSISISRQEIQFNRKAIAAGNGAGNTPGVSPQQSSQQGDSIQKIAAREGRTQEWKEIAAANNIEDPRQLTPGTLLDLNL